MSSFLKKLSDEDLEAVNHLIRRDSHTDLEIAEEALKRLGARSRETKGKSGLSTLPSLPSTDRSEKALEHIVYRYRRSKGYQKWLKNWENRDVELKTAIALQKQRFELLSELVKNPDSNGMETLSKTLQARLLTLAAEATDAELIEGAQKSGWIKNVIRVIQEQEKLERTTIAEKAAKVAADTGLNMAEKQKRIREIFQ